MKYNLIGTVSLTRHIDILIDAVDDDDAARIFWAMADNEPENLTEGFPSYLFNSNTAIDVELEFIDEVVK